MHYSAQCTCVQSEANALRLRIAYPDLGIASTPAYIAQHMRHVCAYILLLLYTLQYKMCVCAWAYSQQGTVKTGINKEK